MYIRMRQGLFLALSDVIDAFVVPEKKTKNKTSKQKGCVKREITLYACL